jgi:predicted short-subunit dehydrogenase-like oxidoreductase (DUF2520 family)
MSDIAIIGTGNLGAHLGYALSRKGHRIKALSDKNPSQARRCRQIIGQGEYRDDNLLAARDGQWIMLTVPDDEIEGVARELAATPVDLRDKFIFHCSGLFTIECLIPLEKRGASVATLHPVQSFPEKKPDPDTFQGIFFGVEGSGKALQMAVEITRQLGARHVVLEGKNKPFYHLACSMASNFLVTLLDMAAELLLKAGLNDSAASEILMPLVQGTLQNVKEFDAGRALTGPVARGDEAAIAEHLRALQKHAELREIYVQMAGRSLQIVRREKKLPAEKIRAMEDLLGGR